MHHVIQFVLGLLGSSTGIILLWLLWASIHSPLLSDVTPEEKRLVGLHIKSDEFVFLVTIGVTIFTCIFIRWFYLSIRNIWFLKKQSDVTAHKAAATRKVSVQFL